MAIEDIKQLRTVNGQQQAQTLLDDGWVILAVCVMQDGTSQYAEYHLGRPHTAASPKGAAGVLLPKRLRPEVAEGGDH
ncbi:hypothetical protein RA263_26080 [Pseudomonas syringae pv. tagetis]|uniref:Lytic transglycosylase n=1 Tax=Pseudomonas syringae pv. tagetis TaxID=129140 RepID=A0A0Q0ARY9_9PSED|nr:hypothetical protein [Pseudomonas syringae group genomosp. 7]KPY81179.1 hypothetical protein ALO44_200077 [Pseudomonas syringae pv. tagetis]RMW10170.1 hypothetical protein ALO98_200089 [Pseudomonas syringae pv. tagetis]RMW20014.1 hypothetical protein ALO97_200006 [Pseudomonas syringae pv. tagetis]UNB71489.1 hypothetical protein MME58_27200 [Pseudomonas syringae pv. tagetis]